MRIVSLLILDLATAAALGFLVAWGVVELCLALVRWLPPRARVLIRLVPLLKVPFDLFRYDWDRWAVLQGVELHHVQEGSRYLSLWFSSSSLRPVGIGLHLESGETFTWLDLLLSKVSTPCLAVMAAALLLYLAIRFTGACIALRRERARLRQLVFDGGIDSPCVIDGEIFIPDHRYTPEELRAVMSHEREHLRWRDSQVKACIRPLMALLPGATLWASRLGLEIERACDASCDPIPLVTALRKTYSAPALAFGTHPIVRRARWALGPRPGAVKLCIGLSLALLVCGAALLGRIGLF